MRTNSNIDVQKGKEDLINFLTEAEKYFRNRTKNEPVHEIISEGLKTFFNISGVLSTAFYSVGQQSFAFSLTECQPKESAAAVEKNYELMLESGFISKVLTNGSIEYCETGDKKISCFIIPVFVPSGIQGLIFIEMSKKIKGISEIKIYLAQHANQIALLLANNRLARKIKNANDLLEQKLAYRTEIIKQKRRELQVILDSLITGVFIIDKKTYEITDVNNNALSLLGFTKSEIVGKNRKQLSPHWDNPYENSGNEPPSNEIELFTESNSIVPALNTIKLVNLSGQEYLLESFIDISRIKKVEIELRNSEYRFKAIFENASFGMVLTDIDFRIMECNLAFRKMLGYTFDELKMRKLYEFIHHPDMIVFNKYFKNMILVNKYNEIRFQDINQNLIWCKIVETGLKYSAETVYYKLFMIEDITSVIMSKDVLYKQTNLLMGVADATNALLTQSDFRKALKQAMESLGKASEVDKVYIAKNIVNDNDELCISIIDSWLSENSKEINKTVFPEDFSYAKYFPGWIDELSEGRTIHGNISPEKAPGLKFIEPNKLKSVMIVPIIVNSQFWGFVGFEDDKKEKVWSEVEESILKATAAGIGGAIMIEESQNQLLKSKEKAEKSDQLKTEFLAQMSHEVRTPINSILSFSGLIRDEFESQLGDEYRSCFNAINRAGERIIRTVDMILNMSDLQTGSYELNPVEYELFDSIALNLSEEFSRKAADKGLSFVLKRPEFSTKIMADEYTINQIFVNLIDNALKYTQEGKVEVDFKLNSEKNFIALIKDTGIGISNEFFPRLFEPFAQEEQGYTRRFEGNGLGLALVKKYCDLNNINIKVDSAKGAGTTFSLSFKKTK